MKKDTIHIEQLYQELLSQDPSLASQKSEIVGLLERMTQHTPTVSIDPLFESRLRDNLRYHLVSQHIPAPQMSNWQKFLVYGIPSLAIGLALIYVLPNMPGSSDKNSTIMIDNNPSPIVTTSEPETANSITTPTSLSDSKNKKETSIPPQQAIKKVQKNQSQIVEPAIYDAKTSESSDAVITTEPMMFKTNSTPEGGEEILQDSSSSQKSTPHLSNQDFSQYNNGITNKQWQLDYNLAYNMEDTKFERSVFINGLLLVRSCNQSFVLDNPKNISNQPNLLLVEAKSDILKESHILTLTMENNQIIDIQGYEKLCQQ